MIVPLSQLDQFVLTCIQQVERGRAVAQGAHLIQTEPPEITFTVQVIDDTQPAVLVDTTETVTPDSESTTTKGTETSTTTQEAVTTTETQVTKPGLDVTSQNFGRTTTTEVSETT